MSLCCENGAERCRVLPGGTHSRRAAAHPSPGPRQRRLEDLEGVGAENIVLVYSGQELLDGYPLANYRFVGI